MRYIFYYFLFLLFGLFYGGGFWLCAQPVIINEWSQGKIEDARAFGFRVPIDACAGSGEWVELLVTASSVDLRNWYVTRGGDNLKLFQFSNHPGWSDIKQGTIILIYNGDNGLDNISCKESYPLGGNCGIMVFSSKNADYLNQSQTKWGWELRGFFPAVTIVQNSMLNNQNHYPKLFNASGAVVHDWSQNNNPAFMAKKPSCLGDGQYCGVRFLGGSVAEVSDPAKWDVVQGGYTSYRSKMTPGAPNKDVSTNANNANEEWIASMQDFPQLPQGVEVAVCQGASFSMKFGPFKNKNGEEFLFRFKRPGGSFALARPEVNLNIASMQPSDTGVYEITTCKPNASCSGCNKRDGSIILKMALPPPNPIELAGQWVACEKGKITIEPQNSSIDPTAEFHWKGPAGFESFANAISFEEEQTTIEKSGIYTLSVTVPACSATVKAEASIIINKQPNIKGIEGPEEVCQGQSLRLSIPPVEGTGIEYKWEGPGGFSATGTPSVTIPATTNASAGVYSLAVEIPGCEPLGFKKEIKITGAPTTFEIASNSPICPGKELILRCEPPIASLEDNDYLWLGPNNAEVGRGNPLILRGAVAEGKYKLKISKGACLNIEKEIEVTKKPIPSIIDFRAIKNPFCEGEPIRFHYYLNTVPAELDFEWKGPNGFSSTLENPTIIAAPGGDGQYNLTIRDKNCGISSNANENVNVVSPPSLFIAVSPSQTVCQGESVTLDVELLPGVEYNWRGPGGFRASQNEITLPNITPAQAGEYSLEAKISGCPPVELKVKVEVLPSAPVPALPQSVYRACGSSAFTFQPTNLNLGDELFLYDAPEGGALIAKGAMPAGVQTPTLTSSQTYYLEAQLQSSRCPSLSRQRVVVDILAEFSPPEPVDTILCEPSAVTFTVVPAPAPGLVVRLWDRFTGGAELSRVGQAPYILTTPRVTTFTAFFIDFFDPQAGCASSRRPVSITLFDRPAAPAPQTQERCGAGAFTFSFLPPPSPTLQYFVYASATSQDPLPGISGNAFQTHVLNEGAHQFYVAAIQLGCTSAARGVFTAKVNPKPEPPAVAATLSRCGPGTLTLTYANAAGNEVILYKQEVGDDILKKGKEPFWEYSLSFSAPGQSYTYFIAQKDIQTGCQSERKALTFRALSEVAFSLSVNERCGAGGVVIEVEPEGASRYEVRLKDREGGTELLRLAAPPYKFEREIATSTSFWVEVVDLDNDCAGGKKVEASVNPIPSTPVLPAQPPACGQERFSFEVANPENDYTLVFYDAPQGGAPIATFTGSPYRVLTPILNGSVTWYAERQSEKGCQSPRVPIVFEINPIPDSPIANRLSRCGAGSFTLTATNFTPGQELRLYTSLGGNPSRKSLNPTLTASVSATTQYYLTYFDPATGCESDPIAWQITVLPELKIDGVREVSGLICGRGAAQLEVDLLAPGSFEVVLEDNRGNPLAVSSSVSSPYLLSTPELQAPTTFRIRVSSAQGCAAETTYTVSVLPLPEKPKPPAIPPICGAGSVTFTIEPGSPAAQRIEIFTLPSPGSSPAQAAFAPFEFTIADILTSTTYYARAQDANGCYSEFTPAPIVVIPPPVAPQVASLYLCGPAEATFTVQNFSGYPSGVSVRVYTQAAGGNFIGQAAPNFNVLVNTGAAYYFAAYNPAARCESQRTKAEVQVFEPIPFEIKRSTPGPLCGPAKEELEAVIARQGRFRVALHTEQGGGAILAESALPPYRLLTPTLSASATFWVSVTDLDFGQGECKTTQPVSIRVEPLPPAPSVPPLPVQCRAASLEVRAQLTSPAPGITLSLYKEGRLINSSIAAPYVFQTPFLTTTTTFFLESFSPATGCQSEKISFTVNFSEPIPSPEVRDIVLCRPGQATFEIPVPQGLELLAMERPDDNAPIKVENGNFSVRVSQAPVSVYFKYQDSNGCQSLPRQAQASLAPAPTIEAVLSTICERGKTEIEVELDRTGNFQVILLDEASTTVLASATQPPYRLLTPEISQSQDFVIAVIDLASRCTTEMPVGVEVTQRPPMPILSSASPPPCGPGAAHFTVSLPEYASDKEARLYATPFGGQALETQRQAPFAFSVYIQTSVTYYVASALLQNGCESAARLPVVLRVTPTLAPPAVSPVRLCQPGMAVFTPIGVPPLGDKIRVYDAPQNGNLLAERELNQTISLPVSGPTEIFYFEAYSSASGCKSELTAAIASVAPPLTLIYDSRALQRCGAGSFTFSVLLDGASQGVIELLDQTQTPALLLSSIEGSSGTFTTPNVSVTTRWALKGKDKTTGCQVTQVVEAKVEPPPAPPVVPSLVEYCGPSATVTAAFGVPSGNKITLYSLPSGGSPLAEVTAPPYTFTLTPGVAESEYYVEATLGDCVSPRSSVTVRRVALAPPSASDLSRAGAGSVVFTAQPGDARGTTIRLYDANNRLIAEKTQPPYELATPLLSADAVFYLRSYDPLLNCESQAVAVKATIIALPPQPSVAASHFRCGPGAVTLVPRLSVAAPENYQIRLYTVASGSEPIGAYASPFVITLDNQNTNACYFLETYEIATGITSAGRTQTCITIQPLPPSPELSAAVERCGPGNVNFSFKPEPGAQVLALYSQAIGGLPLREVAPPLVIENWNLQTTTTYYASYRLSACEGQRVLIAARVHPIPSAPQPLTFEFCSFTEQLVNLRGLANGLGWLIYDTQTSHSPLRQAPSPEATFTFAFNRSTTLWAAAYDLVTGCQSPRSQLSVNLLPPPEPPVASDVSFCTQATQNIMFFAGANQRVELKETPGGSVIRTYAAGACAQGCTFTTPVLSQSTTYYLEAIDTRSGCRSAAKEVKVISQAPNPPQVQPIPICAQGGFVTFSYSLEQTGANQIRLYRSVGNILVTTANQPQGLLRGPYITTSTAFLISAYNTQTQCESPRVLYTVPVRAPLPLPTARRATRCPGQSATLTLTIPEELSGIRLEVYATPTAGAPIFTTAELQDFFILPPSSVNDTVYLVYRDPATRCVSAQQPLEVVITPPPPAPNNQTIIACGSQLVTIRALPSGAVVPEFAEYRLYTQAAAIEPILVSSVPPYDITLRTERNVTYYFAGRDLQTGCESQRAVIRLQRNNPPAPPVALQSPILLCRPGPVTISAAFSGPIAQGIRLYTTPEGGDFIASRAEAPYHFVLPNVTATTTFYLESWNTGFICNTSPRAPVVVRVDPGLEPAAPSVSAPVRFCAGAAAQFTALPGDNSTRAILLYTSASGGEAAQIRREEPFVFSLEQVRSDSLVYLEAANDVCSSGRRTPVLLTPFAKPPVPRVETIEGCGPGKLTFTITNAQAGLTAELWDAQNRLVATSQAGSSFIEVPYLSESATFNIRFNNNGCQGEFVQVRALIKSCSPLQCPAPSKPSLVSAAANRATVAWMPSEGASRYRVTYRQAGAEPQQSVTTANNQITLEGLLPGRTYEVGIQAECIQDGVLTLSASITFNLETPLERKSRLAVDASEFKLYPNPGKGFFFLEAIDPMYPDGQTLELSLWDMLGNLVWSASWSPSSTEPVLGIDWSHLPSASYILKVYHQKDARFYPVLIAR